MPPADIVVESGQTQIRVLAYGPEKTQKTTWVLRAAEAGFNVLLLDGEDGGSVVTRIPPEFRKRILIVNLKDSFDGRHPTFSSFMLTFLQGKPFVWDEQDKTTRTNAGQIKPDHSHIFFNPNKLTLNDVVGLDSWTALATSLMLKAAGELNLDMAATDRNDRQNQDYFGATSSGANYIIKRFIGLNAHLIVVGHATVYEKYGVDKTKGKREIEWSRTQIISTSGPHAMGMGMHFSDIFWFRHIGDGIPPKISTEASKDRQGGSRLIPPGSYKWDDLQFKDVCAKINAQPSSDAQSEAWTYYPPGVMPDIFINQTPQSGNQPLQGGASTKPVVLQPTGQVAKKPLLFAKKTT